LLTPATKVRIQILFSIKRSLATKEIVSYVQKYDRSPSLVVVHDQREKSYDFVQACVTFKSWLTPDSLYFAYTAARQDFLERMAPLFIVLTDGGQPLTTFKTPAVSLSVNQPTQSTSQTVATTAPVSQAARPNFLLQCLAPTGVSSPRKRPNESSADPAPTKRVAT
jgi:hypothetical protein